MEHLSLEIFDLPTKEIPNPAGSKYAWLPPDASITITDTSEIFASGDVWSHSFSLNMPANAHIFGSAGEIHGSRLHDLVNRRRARLWVEGLPMYLGYLKLDDEAEVDEEGNVDVSFESGQKTFDEMIEGAKANQVPMMDDVRFGVALWRKRKVFCRLALTASAELADDKTTDPVDIKDGDSKYTNFVYDGEEEGNAIQQYPRMVFPKGVFRNMLTGAQDSVDCLNTDYPYDDGHPYCNVALCYQKYDYRREDKDGNVTIDYSSEPEAQRGYETMPANRVNSAPNFFVIYWIRALMKHLGIYIEENQMMDVEDLRRLFFVNTKCAYEEPEYLRNQWEERFGRYKFGDGRLVPEQFSPKKTEKINGVTTNTYYGLKELIKVDDSKFTVTDYTCDITYDGGIQPSEVPALEKVIVRVKEAGPLVESEKNDYEDANGFLHDAIASSECFPDADISEVIKAIENGFGVRFLFSDSYQRVRIVLLRNIFRSTDVQDIECDIISDAKVENGIRGFRMTYGNTEDSHFYYKGFADLLPHKKELWVDSSDKHDYSHWNLNADYANIMQKLSAFDKTCYVTPNTGNAYGIKIDQDAKRYDELHPSLFEFAGFMDAEDGDCTGEDETIKTINMGFTPAIMNDLNMETERDGIYKQQFALFVDETMRPRRPDLKDGTDYNNSDALYDVDGKLYKKENGKYAYEDMMAGGVVKPGEFAITSDMFAQKKNMSVMLQKYIRSVTMPSGTVVPLYAYYNITMDIDGHVSEGYRLYLQDNYEPNDDGISPVETHGWGLTLGIMRGSGSDAYVNYEADNLDGEGNDTWEIVPGSSATAHHDTCDSYGNEWDYNGTRYVDSISAAINELARQFPDSNAEFYIAGWDKGYINGAGIATIPDNNGQEHYILIATHRGSYSIDFGQDYIPSWIGHSAEEIMAIDAAGYKIIIEMDSSMERRDTLLELCKRAYDPNYRPSKDMVIDESGVGSRFGRFSLKLRAEKLNPHYNPDSTDPDKQKQYLDITDENLQRRGILDTFYKEYSLWVRNARILRRTVRMGLAQLLAIDKTKKVTVGDVTGFIRKTQYSVSNQTGLGMVTMEIMYI